MFRFVVEIKGVKYMQARNDSTENYRLSLVLE